MSKYVCFPVNVSRSETLPFESFAESTDWLSQQLHQSTLQMEKLKRHVLCIHEQLKVVQNDLECAVLLLCSPRAIEFNASVKARMSIASYVSYS